MVDNHFAPENSQLEDRYFAFSFSSSFTDGSSLALGRVQHGILRPIPHGDNVDVVDYLLARDVDEIYTVKGESSFLGMRLEFSDPYATYSYGHLNPSETKTFGDAGIRVIPLQRKARLVDVA